MKIPALLAALLLALSPVLAAGTGPAGAGAAGAAPRPPAPAAGWSWPLDPRPSVLRAFDPPAKPWLSGHRGVDLRAAHDGAAVTSPAAGTVSFVGIVVDRPVITIDHGNGLKSSFEPVESGLLRGATVAAGDVVGTSQAGHCGPDPCVHWGVRRGGEYLNPLAFVTDLRPSVLLPLEPGRSRESAGRPGAGRQGPEGRSWEPAGAERAGHAKGAGPRLGIGHGSRGCGPGSGVPQEKRRATRT